MKIFHVGSHGINLYLIDSGSHRILLDSGFPGKLNDLGRALRPTGFRLQDIDFLFVTHFHVDHAGAVQELKDQGIRFIAFDHQWPALKEMETMIAGKWAYVPLQVDATPVCLADSRKLLKDMGLDGIFLATPGHSADSISLLLDSGEAFTGDLRAAFLLDETCPQETACWELLRAAGAQTVYPSHGPMYQLTTVP